MTDSWLPSVGSAPAAPQNLNVASPFQTGALDLRWDDPSIDPCNTSFDVVGVNIYRSTASERGPYTRINRFPLGGTFYRDRTDNVLVQDEIVDWNSSWCNRGEGPNDPRWTLQVMQRPMVKRSGQAIAADSPRDVQLTINGTVVPVHSVFGPTGEVTLINCPIYDVGTQRMLDPVLPHENSVVTITYHTNKNLVDTSLDKKLWYRVTTVATCLDSDGNPVTPSGYIETPLQEAPASSPYQIESMDWIWREAVRRNNWMLEQGGERVQVMIRKTSGQVCNHGRDPRLVEVTEQHASSCHTCFVPGTLVRAESGYKPIEKIQPGERVLSADGTFQRVHEVMERDYRGDVNAFWPSVSTRPIISTLDHPVLTLQGSHSALKHGSCDSACDSYIEAGDVVQRPPSVQKLPSGRWWARCQVGRGKRKALGTYETQEEAETVVQEFRRAHSGHVLDWQSAGEISTDTWVVAKWPAEVVDRQEFAVPEAFGKTLPRGMQRLGPDKFNLDPEFLWVLGLYLAEGSSGGRSISFALHRDEVSYQNRVVRYFESLGYHPKVHFHPSAQSAVVLVHSTTLSEWFPFWMGRGCQNKRIPEVLMRLPAERLRPLLQGLYDGDGSCRDPEITQTSEVLALQISEILHRLGEQPLLRHLRSSKPAPSGRPRKLAYCVSWSTAASEGRNRKWRWKFKGDSQLSRVRKQVISPYQGKVYNLEVEGEHTYVVQGIAVHNCFGTGFVGGYEGPYSIIVSPDDAERKVAQRVRGRTVEHQWDIWTGPSPMLTHRDFIVRQNNERYVIGGIRKPSARGNVMQQHFMTQRLDETDLRYKVPLPDPGSLTWPQIRDLPPTLQGGAWRELGHGSHPVDTDETVPHATEKAEYHGAGPSRGRTAVWENINS